MFFLSTTIRMPGFFLFSFCFRERKLGHSVATTASAQSSAMIDLYMKAHSLGLNTADPMGSPYCTARAITDIIISPEGGVYKCTSLTGQEESFVGTIFQGSDPIIKASAEFVYAWNSYEYNEQCKECKFMPMCLGGCDRAITACQ
ncbi:MAG: SPASM domain-containing protein [Candidatus Aegiribacteria sp.]|nr:SPASM domain-containing protein [Candidatus Aegiribacteria sp.]